MIDLSVDTNEFKETILNEKVRTHHSGNEQTVALPDGRQAKRDIVYHADAIAILALTKDNKMILEKQWRAPVKKLTLEILQVKSIHEIKTT